MLIFWGNITPLLKTELKLIKNSPLETQPKYTLQLFLGNGKT